MNYANQIGYIDITPYEVVRTISDKTLEIRRMDAERDPAYKPEFIPGGFSGHCVNQSEQKWIITSNQSASVFRIRKCNKGGWKDRFGCRYEVSNRPVKYYDFNF